MKPKSVAEKGKKVAFYNRLKDSITGTFILASENSGFQLNQQSDLQKPKSLTQR